MNKKVIIGVVTGLVSAAVATTIAIVCRKAAQNKAAEPVIEQ